MTHDFNKPPHITSEEERSQKKRLPVYILVLIGVFFIAVLAYMFAYNNPKPRDAASGSPEPMTQSATATDSKTATTSSQ